MDEERDKSEGVKREKGIIVVLGNPPYNGFAGMGMAEERELSDAYRTPVGDLKPQGQGLNDLYVRFFPHGLTPPHHGEAARHGVVCFISNYSLLESRSCPVKRQHYLNEFDQIWIDCLNGDKYRTGKLTPEGKPDPSVFSTLHNREGIQVGTAIAMMVRKENHQGPAVVRFRDLWGQTKRADLLDSLRSFDTVLYEPVTPDSSLGLPFRPLAMSEEYRKRAVPPRPVPCELPRGIHRSRQPPRGHCRGQAARAHGRLF